jgi:beta-1,4-mannosyltransferase
MRVMMVPDWRRDNPYQQLLADALKSEGVDVVFPTGYRRILPVWRSVRSAQPPVQVLHMHWHEAYIRSVSLSGQCFYGLKLLLDVLIVKASGCRLVWTLHNEVPHDAKRPGFFRALQRTLSRLVDAVIVHSQTALDVLRPQLGPRAGDSVVIPHAHYRDVYGPLVSKQEARRALNLPSRERLLLYFGLIYPYKGVEDLLQAWRQLGVERGSAQLLIVGSPESTSYGERIVSQASDLPNLILRLQFVPAEQVNLYLSAADCMVLPFRKILTSGSLTLASSYSVPVVVPDFAAVREEIAPDEGRFFTPKDVPDLCRAILAEIAAPPRERLEGRVHRHGDWASAAKKTADIYGSVAPQARRKPAGQGIDGTTGREPIVRRSAEIDPDAGEVLADGRFRQH